MHTKLVFTLDKKIIEKAKKIAAAKNISISQMVENFLENLLSGNNAEESEISPFVKSLSNGSNIPNDIDKEEYSRYLLEKYS